MNRLFLIAIIFFGSTSLLTAQKSKVIGVFQLIEKGKYEEAKGIIEDAIKDKHTKEWAKTWYARGLICQNAYRKGIEKKDANLYELYDDQLYVALFSFDKARYYDKRGRYDKLVAPRYVLLANDLIKAGEKYFKNEEYAAAFRAYEYAFRVSKSTILNIEIDNNLLYNTAISAYKSAKLKEAIKYLEELNEVNYSPNVPHLMFSVYMNQYDTVAAHNIILDGIKKYEDNEALILLLVDFLYRKNEPDKAIGILNEAFMKDSSNYIYPYTKGLLLQKTEEYDKAIDAYKVAFSLPSDTLKIYTSIGTCYYNMGAEMDEKARTITNNHDYLEIKEQSSTAFNTAITWFEKAYEIDDKNPEIISKLNLLYKALDLKEKIIQLEPLNDASLNFLLTN